MINGGQDNEKLHKIIGYTLEVILEIILDIISYNLISLPSKDEKIMQRIDEISESLYQDLRKDGVEVLWDERPHVSVGEKFADADLIGLPLRLVISERSLKEEAVEWKLRKEEEIRLVSLQDIQEEIHTFIQS